MNRTEDKILHTGPRGLPRGVRLVLFALLPLVLLGGMIYLLLSSPNLLLGPSAVPPEALQRITIERMAFYPGKIVVSVRNINTSSSSVAVIPAPTVSAQPYAMTARAWSTSNSFRLILPNARAIIPGLPGR